MNKERVQQCIKLMQGAKRLDMTMYQGGDHGIAKSVRQLHSCGNTACFAGYLAMAPFFKGAGGEQLPGSGMPRFNNRNAERAVAEFLGISEDLADDLVYGTRGFYAPVKFEKVQPADVIKKLELILEGELK